MQRSNRLALLVSLAIGAAPGCKTESAATDGMTNGDAGMMGGPADMARPALGQPITAPKDAWTWVDFPDSFCDDGTTTGVGIKLTDSKNVLLFLNGGGACWDYTTCVQLNTSTHGPFGAAQFASFAKGDAAGTIFGGDASNPFADWNMVFIPYCTGDVHAGDNVKTYTNGSGGDPHVIHHVGHANILAYFKRLAATFPNPDKLVVSGSSAGGFGAAINYDTARTYWPDAKSYLIDDSGPPLVGDDIRSFLRDAWFAAWNIDASLGAPSPACKDDLSAFIPIITAKYPKDRLALLETYQDRTISGYYLISGAQLQTDLACDLAPMRLDPAANMKYFFETGTSHTMLGDLAVHSANNVALTDWIKQEVTDDPAWTTAKDGVSCP